MSSSLCLYGIKPVDETYKNMKTIYDAYEAANKAGLNLDLPEAVRVYFNHAAPDPEGVIENLCHLRKGSERFDFFQCGFELDVSEIPPGTKILRVVLG